MDELTETAPRAWVPMALARRLAFWFDGKSGWSALNSAFRPGPVPIPTRIPARELSASPFRPPVQRPARIVPPTAWARHLSPTGGVRSWIQQDYAELHLEVEAGALERHFSGRSATRIRAATKSISYQTPVMRSPDWWSQLEALAWLATHDEELVQRLRPLAHSDDPRTRTDAFRALCWGVAQQENVWRQFVDDDDLPTVSNACTMLERAIYAGTLKAAVVRNGVWQEAPPALFAAAACKIALATFALAGDMPVLFNKVDVQRLWPAERPNAVTSTGAAESQCKEWLIKAFEADPNKHRRKASFREDAIAAFPGRLTERGFDHRVWPELALQYGRDNPGAKKQS